jgi:SAM-dependent methyltransferase
VPVFTEPLARGLDLGSAEAGDVQRTILRTKLPLRRAYEQVYAKMLAAADEHVAARGGSRVELGSGGGFLQQVSPDVVATDIKAIPDLDLVMDARALPFRDASIDVVFAMHVVHHVPQVRLFLDELIRCLKPGGALVAVEPYWSPVARLLYKHAHPEPFDETAAEWEFPSTDPLCSNQALSYLMLERDRTMLDRDYPQLEVVRLPAFGGPSYVLTGGIWKRQMLPTRALARLAQWEDRTAGWRRWAALHHLFVVRRRS